MWISKRRFEELEAAVAKLEKVTQISSHAGYMHPYGVGQDIPINTVVLELVRLHGIEYKPGTGPRFVTPVAPAEELKSKSRKS
jgi:hypothetical protein